MQQHLYGTQYTTKYIPPNTWMCLQIRSRASPLRIRKFCLENLVCLYVHLFVGLPPRVCKQGYMLVQSKPHARKAHVWAWSVSSRHKWSISKCTFDWLARFYSRCLVAKWHGIVTTYTIVAVFLLHSACLFAIASLVLQGIQFTLLASCSDSTSSSFYSTPICCWHAFAALCWPQ